VIAEDPGGRFECPLGVRRLQQRAQTADRFGQRVDQLVAQSRSDRGHKRRIVAASLFQFLGIGLQRFADGRPGQPPGPQNSGPPQKRVFADRRRRNGRVHDDERVWGTMRKNAICRSVDYYHGDIYT
jgi:hypothetical protein